MQLGGNAVVIRERNVDTDVLYPGPFLSIQDVNQMKQPLFEGLNPALRDELVGDTVLIVGENFGTGSSREHVPQAMKASGIRCVVGKSFARIFYRNCINLGMPVVVCPGAAEAASPGSRIRIDTEAGTVEVDGKRFEAKPIPAFMHDMLSSGGLVEWARVRSGAVG